MKVTVNEKIAYAYTGTKPFIESQPTAVFIHGAANDHSVWAWQSRYFAHHGWNVLAIDLPGHGQSEGPSCATVEEFAKWVGVFLDAANVASAFVIGHSMGSLIALELAGTRSDSVSKLALIGAAVPMAVGDALLDAAANDEEKARKLIIGWSYAPASQLGNNHKVPGTWLPGNSMALMRRMPKGLLHSDLSACKAYANGLNAAAKVNCPSMVVIGEQDMMTPPKAAQAVIRNMKNVHAETINGAGHTMCSEAPDSVLKVLWSFAGER
jgi:pimeloyl-ACP methyl ester carboxylesterase